MIKTLSVSVWCLLALSLSAQQNPSAADFNITLRSKYNGLPTCLTFNPASANKPNSEGMASWFRGNLGANMDFALKQLNTTTDIAGNKHTRYKQFYKDIPVEGTLLQMHYNKTGTLVSLTGSFFPALNVAAEPAITEADALKQALAIYGSVQFAWQDKGEEAFLKQITANPEATYLPKGELVIISDQHSLKPEDCRLAYKFNVYATAPLSREWVYVDAIDGKILFREELIHTIDRPGIAHTKYNGVQTIMCDSAYPDTFFLRETGRGMGIETYNAHRTLGGDSATMFYDNDNDWDNVNAQQDEVATDVHWGLEKTFDFYQAKLARNSIDDGGTKLIAMAHVNKKLNNAYWNGQYASFGDGDSTDFKPLTSLDVCGHEISHGMTQMTAGLVYMYESGAINESFSDIFGKCIEHFTTPDQFTWKIGNSIRVSGSPLRNMQDPNTQLHPRYYSGRYYYKNGFWDNGGVHVNSGVQNYWFYLLCEGGSGKREDAAKNPYTVTAIGMDKATQIAYNTLINYLNSSSDYSEVSTFSIQVAKALYGDKSEEARQTQMAWYAVGLAEFPGYGLNVPATPAYANVTLYPNPASQTLTLSVPAHTAELTVTLTDIAGKQLETVTVPASGTIDVSSLQSGMYFVALPDGTTLKFVKL